MRVAPPVVLDAPNRKPCSSGPVRARFLHARSNGPRSCCWRRTGETDLEIAADLRISNQKAARWRKRFLELGLAGLDKDAPRPGRKPAIAARLKAEVIRKTTQSKPSNATHWSTRTMAAEMGISEATVRRIWHAHG